MQDISTKKLEDIENLIDKGKYLTALESIERCVVKENISTKGKIQLKISQTRVYFEIAAFEKAIERGETAFKESQKINDKKLMFDSVLYLPFPYFLAGNYEKSREKIRLGRQILDSFKDKNSKDYLRRKIQFLTAKVDNYPKSVEKFQECIAICKRLNFVKELVRTYHQFASACLWAGELAKALRFIDKALELSRTIENRHQYNIITSLKGIIHMHRGELDIALSIFFQVIPFFEDSNNLFALAGLFMDLGYIYWLKKEYQTALENYRRSISILNKIGITQTRHLPWVLFRTNILLQELGEDEEVQKNMNQIKHLYALKTKDKNINLEQRKHKETTYVLKVIYYLTKAIYLKSKTNETNINQAIACLEEIVDEEFTYLEINGLTIFHLCDLYLKKILETNNGEFYEKLKSRIKKAKKIAEKQHSYILLVQVLLLQSKLELIDFNITKGQLLLEKAQNIAEDKGIIYLAKIISNEYDMLLSQLDVWEDMSKYLPKLEDRMEFTHIEEVLATLIRNRLSHENVVDEKESPLLFLIMDKNNSILFSEPLRKENIDETLPPELFEVINDNNDTLNDKIKRVKHKEYAAIISHQQDVRLIYIFIGKSYYASQKLRKLVEEFQAFTSNWTVWFSKIVQRKELSLTERIQLSENLENIFG